MNRREALIEMTKGKRVSQEDAPKDFYLYLTEFSEVMGSDGEFVSIGNFPDNGWFVFDKELLLERNQLVIIKGNMKTRGMADYFPIGMITTADNVWEYQLDGDFQGDIKKVKIDQDGLVWEVE